MLNADTEKQTIIYSGSESYSYRDYFLQSPLNYFQTSATIQQATTQAHTERERDGILPHFSLFPALVNFLNFSISQDNHYIRGGGVKEAGNLGRRKDE